MNWTEEEYQEFLKSRGIQKARDVSPKKPKQKAALKVPTESEEQQALFTWASAAVGKYPALEYMFHIPNGGSRGKAEAGIFKAEGVKAGVPDVCLPQPIGRYHGLYIEMKRIEGSKTSDEQLDCLRYLAGRGYYCAICYGWEQARVVIEKYLNMK